MTTILICWTIGVLLPYIWAGASVPFRSRQFGTVDLKTPRLQGEQMTEGGARAVGAQGNAWEALIVFSVANVAAIWAGADPSGTWSTLAIVWVVARILHGVFYLTDVAVGRIAAFVTGFVMSLWILSQAFTV